MEQAELLRRAIGALEALRVPYAVVGSIASMAYGEPRSTNDIDIVIGLMPSQVEALCEAFPAPEYYVSLPAARQALMQGGQFNVIHPASGNKIDFLTPPHNPWGRKQLQRRQRVEIVPGVIGYTASPDDIIVGKMWYYHEGGSEKHLRDIAAILQVSDELVDREYVRSWAEQLGLLDIWQAVLTRLGQGN